MLSCLHAAKCSRLSTGMLTTSQSDWMSCVQRHPACSAGPGLESREQSVGARRRACPTHRRRFWRNCTSSGVISVSRRSRSLVRCSSGVLATILRSRLKCTPSRCTASEIGHTSALGSRRPSGYTNHNKIHLNTECIITMLISNYVHSLPHALSELNSSVKK